VYFVSLKEKPRAPGEALGGGSMLWCKKESRGMLLEKSRSGPEPPRRLLSDILSVLPSISTQMYFGAT